MRSLHGVAVALVGVAVPIATVAALAGSIVAAAVAVLISLAFAAYVAAAPRIWTEAGPIGARAAVISGAVLATAALTLGVFGEYVVAIDHDVCGGGTGQWLSIVLAGVGYAGAAAWLLRTSRRLVWAWPLLVLLAAAARVGLLFVLPGTQGYCET
jgi:hypothetical protein